MLLLNAVIVSGKKYMLEPCISNVLLDYYIHISLFHPFELIMIEHARENNEKDGRDAEETKKWDKSLE